MHYARVVVEGTTVGTLSSSEGEFELSLHKGPVTLTAQLLGYAKQSQQITVNGPIKLAFVLLEEDIEIEDAIITSSGKDPAYWIIKQAIRQKDENRMDFQVVQFTSYQKTIIKDEVALSKLPEEKDFLQLWKKYDSIQQAPAGPSNAVNAPIIQEIAGPASQDSIFGAFADQLLPLLPSLLAKANDSSIVRGINDLLAQTTGLPSDTSANFSLPPEILQWIPQLVNALPDSVKRELVPLLGGLGGPLNSALSGGVPTALMDSMLQYYEGGIAFLEESVTRSTFERGKLSKEEIISAKNASPSDDNIALLGTLARLLFDFDPYKNLTDLKAVSTEIVSPLSSSALLYYRYKLLGTLRQNGRKQYKIQLWPISSTGPAFTGVIYIADSSYAITQSELYLTKINGIAPIDSILISKDYVFLPSVGKWAPLALNARLSLGLGLGNLGSVKLVAESQQVKSEYAINPELPKNFLNRELVVEADSAYLRGKNYWEDRRQFGLEKEEELEYERGLREHLLESSPEWQDSMTRASRKFNLLNFLVTGYQAKNYRNQSTFHISPIWKNSGFNPVEGWVLELSGGKTWNPRKELGKKLQSAKVDGAIRAGFANQKVSWRTGLSLHYSPMRRFQLTLELGDMPQEFSQFKQTYFLQMLTYNLLLKENYQRIYQRKFAMLRGEREIANGLRMDLHTQWEWRTPWSNQTQFSFLRKDSLYAPNLPLLEHQAWVVGATLHFQPFNRYILRKGEKINLGSKWPKFTGNMQWGIPSALGSDVDFLRLTLEAEKDFKLGTIGKMAAWGQIGGFAWKNDVPFPDAFHFAANQTLFRNPSPTAFQLMDYYSHSTRLPFFQVHAEHCFNRFIMNKIPLLKKLHLTEYAELHSMATSQFAWVEMGIGLQKGFFHRMIFIRANYHQRIVGQGGLSHGWTFGLTSLLNSLGK